MKKFFILSTLLIIGVLSFYYFQSNKKQISEKTEFSPKELWDIEFKKKKEKRKVGYDKADKPDEFSKYFKDITTKVGESESSYKMNYKVSELNKAKERSASLKNEKIILPWIQRGPGNVGGRTRAVIIDPDDASHNTWYAGAATGGIWKTTDGGSNWTNLSENFSNLSVNALEMSTSNTDIIYAGTGESFPGGTNLKGNGIWKSTDRGVSWTQLSSTSTDENFAYINRLVIDPSNADIVLAATETGIYKSIDGGSSWNRKYFSSFGVEDLTADPTNFDILFAGENSAGILRSVDAGNTWAVSSDGIGAGGRFEVTVSNVDHNYVYAGVDVSSTESSVYFSTDNGINWKKYNDSQNFLGGQGGYDNAISAHPYIADEVFVGGVDIWKLKFNGAESSTVNPEILRAFTVNTSFLSFINYGGPYLGGGMSADNGNNLVPSDWVSVEIRFGPGISQKAHRFTVPAGSTSGVPASSYTYQDYIDVPFEVWDVTNNIQLMVSFRDQEIDNVFNLYERTGDNYGEIGREYIFVNSVPYNPTTPNTNITTNGGHLYKNLYMFWPTLTPGQTWEPNNLPNSKIVVTYGTITQIAGVKTSIADAYGNYGGPNGFNQGAGLGQTSIPGLHPDHHNLTIIPTGAPNFIFIDANDGGFGYSNDNGMDINQIPNNYITTQFYGVAKHPTENEYFGGMQDNGSWQSPVGEDASSSSNYFFRIGGDGFEALWHAENPYLMLGSVYNNAIRRSNNKGATWHTVSGIVNGDGPFYTKLSVSKEDPDLVFAVRNGGVYRSTNFGQSWSPKAITTNWLLGGYLSGSHNVEVSLANGKIVWAGGGMATRFDGTRMQMQVSTNYGNSFTPVNDYSLVTMQSYISGIATHPRDENTAYILFSRSNAPKVLRTTNLGQTWTDISGFGTGSVSNNGFPNVVTHCLLVMPHNPNIIWVGTDIGLFESTDNGVSWHIADNGLPNVSVFDMHISGNQVVIATHGRGIWSVDIEDINKATYIKSLEDFEVNTLKITTNLKVSYDSVEVYLNNALVSTEYTPSTGVQDLTFPNNTGMENVSAYIIGYISNEEYQSNTLSRTVTVVNIRNLNNKKDIEIYPNPSSGKFYFKLDANLKEYKIEVYSLNGKNVFSQSGSNSKENSVNLSSLKDGIYIIKIKSGQDFYSKTIQIKK